jgi:hypothetical protein
LMFSSFLILGLVSDGLACKFFGAQFFASPQSRGKIKRQSQDSK